MRQDSVKRLYQKDIGREYMGRDAQERQSSKRIQLLLGGAWKPSENVLPDMF